MSSYPNFNAREGQPRRDQDKVVLYLAPKQPIPDLVPYELHEHIFPDEWHSRLTRIRDMAFRFYNPLFERVWIIIATLCVIIIPLALYQVIFDAMFTNGPHTPEHFYRARMVAFAVFVGTFIIFWAPMLIWKAIGKRRLRSLLNGWEKVDRAGKAPGAFVPVWRTKSPSAFKSTCVVTITAPPNIRPTIFHPNAYVPPYINPPTDPARDYYFYPYAPGQGHAGGLPRMSVAGTLPAYKAEPGAENKYSEDVKV